MKGIEWIKLSTCMCEDEKMRLIDSMECRDSAYYLWVRLLLQAGKVNDNGLIYLKKDVPYTKEMISILFNRPIEIVEKVFEIFETFKMIKIYENNIIKICNWENHQNIEGMKRVRENTKERVKNHRERKKKEKELLQDENLNPAEALSNAEADDHSVDKINIIKKCNAHVTLQKEKREEDKKNKIKNTDEEEREEINSEIYTEKVENNDFTEAEKNTDGKVCEIHGNEIYCDNKELDVQALNLMKAIEKINVSIKGVTISGVKEMLVNHKEKYVKMAMEKAIEKNKLDINYINGILKNWRREGYPKIYGEMEVDETYSDNNLVFLKEKSKLRFNNFEPRKYDYKELEKQLLGW